MDTFIKIIVSLSILCQSLGWDYGEYNGDQDYHYFEDDQARPRPNNNRQNWGYHNHRNHYHNPHDYTGHPRQFRNPWGWSGPNKNWQYPNDKFTWPTPVPTTTTARMPTTQSSLALTMCMRSCPVTPEYNPVCGTNNITYSNVGRLECAKYCGVDVQMRRQSACPIISPPSQVGSDQSTNGLPTQNSVNPITNPASNTQSPAPVTEPAFTIPPDVLSSIFSQTTDDPDDIDIDIRTRGGKNAVIE